LTISISRDDDFRPAIKKIMDELAKLEEKIDLIKSNTELQLKTKKVK